MVNLKHGYICLVLLGMAFFTQAGAEPVWQQIDASSEFIDNKGILRKPSCSGGPVVSAAGAVPGKTAFSFFIREGNPKKLLLVLDGGGACWDSNTCIGSALAGRSIYNQEVNETPELLAEAGGIGDLNNPDNPLADYTQVFVPYCTADLHMGSKDTAYTFYTPEGIPLPPWTIHHRGYDNLMAVLEWLDNYYQSTHRHAPHEVVVAGGSAGGYGMWLALPAIEEMLPRTSRTFVLADSANAVISDDFYNRALGGYAVSGGVWGVEQNIPEFLLGAFASGANAIAVSTYATLAWRYPQTRFGQYTRAWDATQIFYYNVAKQVEYPERWNDPAYLLPTAVEWSLKARAYMHLTALSQNYRFYLGAGSAHTLLADDSFYTEDSAAGVHFSSWLDDMINQRQHSGSDWRNVSCFPNCLP